ncbi:MAG: hypothetical protein HFI85_01005 [Clostridia bacterium]|nr:hypothetical protein [Clostridia bacterium]
MRLLSVNEALRWFVSLSTLFPTAYLLPTAERNYKQVRQGSNAALKHEFTKM